MLTEHAILQELRRWTSGLPLTELKKIFNVSPETLGEILEKMEKRGLIVHDRIGWYEVNEGKHKEDEKRKSGPQLVFTSFYEDDSEFYEEIYDSQEGARFVSWNRDKPRFVPSIAVGDKTFMPINDDALQEGAILLPEKPEEYGSLGNLINEIRSHIHTYLDISEDYEIFATYYILLTWVYDRVDTLPYLRALGDTGTGKSRFLDVIGRLCYKPCIVSGAITPAPIYRMIRKWRGTIILDEADFRDSSEKNEVITILNCGFERGRPVIRCNMDRPDELEFLPTFSPKVFSTRYPFRDKALESRCLTEQMAETSRRDIPSVLSKKFYKDEMSLRNKLLLFRFRYRNSINTENVENLNLGEIEPRLKQATSSFAALFSNISELMQRFRQFLEKYNQELVEERASTFEGVIVNTIFSLREEGKEDISSSDIAERIEEDYGIKRPDFRVVGKYLRSLRIKTYQKRIESVKKRCIAWDRDLMERLKKRYCPQVNDTNGTDGTDGTLKNLNKNVPLGPSAPSIAGRGENKVCCFYHRDRRATHEVDTVDRGKMKLCEECYDEWRRLKAVGQHSR